MTSNNLHEDAPPTAPELPLYEEWEEEPARRAPRLGVTMRHPVLLVFVMAASVFMVHRHWRQATRLLEPDHLVQFGEITDRPHLKSEAPESLPRLEHNRYGKLSGVVESTQLLWTGPKTDSADPVKKLEDRKYYLKLLGDRVFVMIAARRADVREFRMKHNNSLLGFALENATGRMIAVDSEPSYRGLAATLRYKHSIPDDEPIWVFDTTAQPMDPRFAGGVVGLTALIALLALFGLVRLGIRRLST